MRAQIYYLQKQRTLTHSQTTSRWSVRSENLLFHFVVGRVLDLKGAQPRITSNQGNTLKIIKYIKEEGVIAMTYCILTMLCNVKYIVHC